MSASSSQDECRPNTLQRVSLEKAVAPILNRPIAPFDRSERKRAYRSALFYSECFLHGIEPLVADDAAVMAQGTYDKWWVNSTASAPRLEVIIDGDHPRKKEKLPEHVAKKMKQITEVSSGDTSEDAVDSSGMVSISSSAYFQDDEKEDDLSNGSVQASNHQLLDSHSLSKNLSNLKTLNIEVVKQLLIEELRSSGGNVFTPEYLKYQRMLEKHFNQHGLRGFDRNSLEGNWLTISKPTFTECKGVNEKGENVYSLGRISFDMFKPTGLLCSFQASFNHIQVVDPNQPGRPLHVPRCLVRDIRSGHCILHTYDVVTAITIEPGQDRKGNIVDRVETDKYAVPKPIRAILTTHGYSVPDPTYQNRLSIWFSGGTLEVQDEIEDLEEWKHIFDTASTPNRDMREYANNLAARLLLGAHSHEMLEEDGTLRFELRRPIGGHGSVFCDIVYMDDTLRIMHGHHDSVYVCVRVPKDAETDLRR